MKPWQRWGEISPAAILIFLIILGIAAAGCTGTPGSPRENHLAANDGKLNVYFLDVGQGDSAVFLFNNKTILIDAGETDMGDRVVADLNRLGVTRIDLLVATHPHSDHIGGMQRVLQAFPVGQVLDSGLPQPTSTYENFLLTIERRGIPYTVAEQGQVIDVDPSLRIFVLSPPAQRFGDDPNTNSVVLRISFGTIDFLMTGDAGGEAEDALVRSGYALDAEILKVGHHGSEYSTSKAFLERVHPEVGVISVGEGNPYGHPHQQTLDALSAAGVRVYRTDQDGTVHIRSDGVSYSVSTEKQGGIWQAVATLAAPLANVTFNTSSLSTFPPLPANVSVHLPPLGFPQIGNASSVVIDAAQFDAPGDDRTNLDGEWVRLTNQGNDTVLLNGWTLTDRTGSFSYVFPAYLLEPGSSVTVYTGAGALNDTSLFMDKKTPVWGNGGDTAILRDFRGEIITEWNEGGTA